MTRKANGRTASLYPETGETLPTLSGECPARLPEALLMSLGIWRYSALIESENET